VLIDDYKKEIAERIREYFREKYGVEPKIRFTPPPSFEVADIATPIGFSLAKVLKRPPEDIAKEAAEVVKGLDFVEKVEVAKGYINVFLDKKRALKDLLEELQGDPLSFEKKNKKVVVEHTNINPNKAAHIGHVRNAVLGDALARILRRYGYDVEVQNYIDDTGVQVADTVVGLRFLRGLRKEDLDRYEPLDKYCRHVYTLVNKRYEIDKELVKYQREVLKELERGSSELAEFAREVSRRICKRHIETMYRLEIEYDLLTRESHIIRLGLAEEALRKLKEKGVAVEGEDEFSGAIVIKLPNKREFKALDKGAKVLVRSDGTFTYLLKDIGYTLRKFGLVDKDFLYDVFMRYPSGKELRTTSFEGKKDGFGKADIVINVIDIRQGVLQAIIRYALEAMGYEEQARNFIHYAYGVVHLSKKTAERFGIYSKKEIVKMSGRKGIGIIADDLFDEIEKIALENILSKHPELDLKEAREIARKIMVASVRYMMLKYDRLKDMVFDIEEAMNLSGESGPYIQYSVVRAKNIIKKSEPAEFDPEGAFLCDKERPLVRSLLEIRERFVEAAEKMDPQLLARYAYELAMRFNEFYESCRVAGEPDHIRGARLGIVKAYIKAMELLLDVLGIPIVEVM